ncbi:MAG: ABC transporter permease [Thermoprotei archaeon]
MPDIATTQELTLFLLRRILSSIFAIIGVFVIVFLVSHALSPDPARLWAGPKARSSTIYAVEVRYHLNQPYPIQFYYFIKDYLTGNLGVDPVTGKSIASEIAYYLPNTLELVLASLVVIVVVGVFLGYVSAVNFGGYRDAAIRVFYLASWATPTYLGAILAVLGFATYLRLFPSGGMYSPTLTPPPHVTGIFILDSLIAGDWADFASGVYHLTLPALTLAFLNFGIITRVARSSMLEAKWSPHVKQAAAKGLPTTTIRVRHVLRNGLIDVNTLGAVMFGWLLGGTVVVEQIFAWPGIGQFAYSAIASDNYPVLIPVVLVFTVGVILANLVADILYSVLDPRIRLGGGR